VNRSPSKRYEPSWRNYLMYGLLLVVEVFARDGVAGWYMEGPWCRRCYRNWRDDWPGRKGVKCSCGATDPVALKAWEAANLPPSYQGFGLGGADPWTALLGAALIGAAMGAKRREWWKGLGLEERPADAEEAKKAYRQAQFSAHPDHGGSREQMESVDKAWAHAERDYARG